jgi:hypothetical protein
MNLDEIIPLEPVNEPGLNHNNHELKPEQPSIKYNNLFSLLSCFIVMASSLCCGYNIGLTNIPLNV